MTVEWFADDILKQTNSVVAEVAKDIAKNVMKDAMKILKQTAKAKVDKDLLKQFYVEKSIFKNGGYLVWCQGPDKWWPPYRASFVEMGHFSSVYGTYKREGARSLKGISPVYIPPKPFMRPAVKKNRRKANKMYRDALL